MLNVRSMTVLRLAHAKNSISPTIVKCSNVPDTSVSSMSARHYSETREPEIPPYQERVGEAINIKKARLLYQSRKRGMLENGLLLSTFADRYLKAMSPELAQQYDRLINLPSNDWDIFYWATNVKPTPKEFDNEVMKMFKEHVKNTNREARYHQPEVITF